jgi:hypothetical protein
VRSLKCLAKEMLAEGASRPVSSQRLCIAPRLPDPFVTPHRRISAHLTAGFFFGPTMPRPPLAMEVTEAIPPSIEPFQRLWAAVIEMQVRDAMRSRRLHLWGSTTVKRHTAMHWLMNESRDFSMVCDMAGLEPAAVRARTGKMFGTDTQEREPTPLLVRNYAALTAALVDNRFRSSKSFLKLSRPRIRRYTAVKMVSSSTGSMTSFNLDIVCTVPKIAKRISITA